MRDVVSMRAVTSNRAGDADPSTTRHGLGPGSTRFLHYLPCLPASAGPLRTGCRPISDDVAADTGHVDLPGADGVGNGLPGRPHVRRRRLGFQLHVAMCPRCRAYLQQMKATVLTLGRLPEEPLPPDVARELLHRFRNWKVEDRERDGLDQNDHSRRDSGELEFAGCGYEAVPGWVIGRGMQQAVRWGLRHVLVQLEHVARGDKGVEIGRPFARRTSFAKPGLACGPVLR